MTENKDLKTGIPDAQANREYKDGLFRFLFGNERNRHFLLSLVNALLKKNYTNTDILEINTLNNVFFISCRNDVSCIIDTNMLFIEQQSTINRNMPYRMFSYTHGTLSSYLEKTNQDVFRTSFIRTPKPRYYVLYNGLRNQPEIFHYALSDHFLGEEGDNELTLELVVKGYNINAGQNEELKLACKPLEEYQWMVERIHKNRMKMRLENAILTAIKEMPKDYLIYPFIKENIAEVIDVMTKEYTEEEIERIKELNAMDAGMEMAMEAAMEVARKKAREEVWKEAEAEGIAEGTKNAFNTLLGNLMKTGLNEAEAVLKAKKLLSIL